MKYIRDDDNFMLTTGRIVEGNGPFRLSIEEGDSGLCYGYDARVWEVGPNRMDVDPFTEAERAEIADYMIAAWQRWKERGST